ADVEYYYHRISRLTRVLLPPPLQADKPSMVPNL
ncbi:hypothetical protein A2U01_0109691, partial [Trifolium medium]|nr:hypothetical protein [Trifolium medium]